MFTIVEVKVDVLVLLQPRDLDIVNFQYQRATFTQSRTS